MTDLPQYTTGDLERPLSGSVGVDVTLASSLTVHFCARGGTPVSRAATVTDAETGAWSMAWQAGDLAVATLYDVEVEVAWPGPRPQTFGPAHFRVREQIA